MNKIPLSALVVAALSVVGPMSASAWAQAAKPAAGSTPHKIALIDMAYVFKNYEKFNVLREDLKKEVMASEEVAKQKAEELKKLQQEMKTFQEGSPEFTAREKKFTTLAAEFETFRKATQRDFIKKESQIYHTIYMDVADMVKRYAEHPQFNYTLVMRFNREELDTDNAQKLIEGMNRQVVYYKEEDDITDAVTDALNRKFRSTGSAAQSAPKPPAGGASGARSATPPSTSSTPRPGTSNR